MNRMHMPVARKMAGSMTTETPREVRNSQSNMALDTDVLSAGFGQPTARR